MSSKNRKPIKPVAKPSVKPVVIRAVTAAPTAAPGRNQQVELKPRAQVTADDIARAAYFLWLQRGGNPTVNWLEAEAKLKGTAGKA